MDVLETQSLPARNQWYVIECTASQRYQLMTGEDIVSEKKCPSTSGRWVDSLSGILLEAMAKGWQSPGSIVYTH